ncbi:MAG: hypothetical protein NT099_01905 [Candidatus Saganbacteria bacterium]|nr:hypothetical protein [Candidatus Saganbacteria bacterium]
MVAVARLYPYKILSRVWIPVRPDDGDIYRTVLMRKDSRVVNFPGLRAALEVQSNSVNPGLVRSGDLAEGTSAEAKEIHRKRTTIIDQAYMSLAEVLEGNGLIERRKTWTAADFFAKIVPHIKGFARQEMLKGLIRHCFVPDYKWYGFLESFGQEALRSLLVTVASDQDCLRRIVNLAAGNDFLPKVVLAARGTDVLRKVLEHAGSEAWFRKLADAAQEAECLDELAEAAEKEKLLPNLLAAASEPIFLELLSVPQGRSIGQIHLIHLRLGDRGETFLRRILSLGQSKEGRQIFKRLVKQDSDILKTLMQLPGSMTELLRVCHNIGCLNKLFETTRFEKGFGDLVETAKSDGLLGAVMVAASSDSFTLEYLVGAANERGFLKEIMEASRSNGVLSQLAVAARKLAQDEPERSLAGFLRVEISLMESGIRITAERREEAAAKAQKASEAFDCFLRVARDAGVLGELATAVYSVADSYEMTRLYAAIVKLGFAEEFIGAINDGDTLLALATIIEPDSNQISNLIAKLRIG